MERKIEIANRVREVLLNGKWVANTNYKEHITDINWIQATKQFENLNTVALLTFHINYYLEGLLKVFAGGPLDISDKYSFDMTPILTEEDWQRLVKSFIINAEGFAQAIESMPDSKLDEKFVKEQYGTYLRNIEGVIEHSYYHLGQISLIKKLIAL